MEEGLRLPTSFYHLPKFQSPPAGLRLLLLERLLSSRRGVADLDLDLSPFRLLLRDLSRDLLRDLREPLRERREPLRERRPRLRLRERRPRLRDLLLLRRPLPPPPGRLSSM